MTTPKKLMLINANHDEESRVAIVEDGYLHELDIESASKALTKSNIYKGKITKVEASLQAAFVEYGSNRQGFLSLSEIHPDYWKEGVDKSANPRNLSIQDILQPKQEILVQVVKEERGNKGAALTTQISLAGRYLVLSPNTTRGGISRKLSDDERRSMKEILSQLEVPENMGLIIRTAGKDQNLEALQRDYNYLRRLWDEIRIKSETTPSPALIYLEGDLATRAIRDHFSDDVQEIWVDNHEVYTQTKAFVHAVLPGKEKLVKLYRGRKPLFRHYGVESQCEEIHEREIRLPSGGSIVLDPTEALTAIDINSSRATKGKHIDDTALAINLEAAEEIARQLRIRDIGGLIVIDFIDMASRKHGQQVEETLRKACKGDKARIQFARISRFGLLEMSRQRLHPSVRESTTEPCPRCQGRGSIRTVESMALQMLTRMEDWAEEGKKPTLIVQVPSDTGEYLMNNKRANIARIEEVNEVQITLQIRPDLDIPHYRIERQWTENNQQRVEVLEDTSKKIKPPRSGRKLKPVKPVVGIPTPPPPEPEVKKDGPLKTLLNILTGANRKERLQREAEEEERRKEEEEQRQKRRRSRGGRNRRRGSSERNGDEVAASDSEQKQSSEAQKPKRKRTRKPRPERTEPTDIVASENDESAGEAKPRRRRRRRRRPASKDGDSSQSQDQSLTEGQGASSGETPETGGENSQESREKRSRPRRRKPAASSQDTPASAEKQESASSASEVATNPEKQNPAARQESKPDAVAAPSE
ncbi:ribonuclease E [Mariprofundus ferrinatatus]|uniref:Ribonuclease G n=1 Tax=Mariprofundus ferrinatatus TaxID=1921087 RepID=A0A2K8L2P8_9PROT|nr:Rne/Rng family ribonuclease [Mariprofundus ferrinatatus]ATX81598.1 ribonuclease E [Mariprofundus ferrinatatus]